MWPEVTVLICTYNRIHEILEVIEALNRYLQYAGKVHWVVCDDSSPDDYQGKLARSRYFQQLGIKIVKTETNSGWAANVNWGLACVDTDYVFFIEDDYVLKTFLDLGRGVALLQNQPQIGMIRYRGTAGDEFTYHQHESDISQYQPDYMQSIGGVPGKLTYLDIDPNSKSLYIYSHGPHLKRRAFHDYYGFYPTGMKLGATEEAFAHTVQDKMRADPFGAPHIAILPDWIPMMFDHIGKSYQHTEFDHHG